MIMRLTIKLIVIIMGQIIMLISKIVIVMIIIIEASGAEQDHGRTRCFAVVDPD